MINEPTLPLLGRDDVFIVPTGDGSLTLFSKACKATYHSIFGAVSESRHTYIQKCLLTQQFREKINILEFGFGTGLNALLSYIFGQKHDKSIEYTGIETYRLDISLVRELDYAGYLAYPLLEDIFFMMHQSNSFTETDFTFQLQSHWDNIKPGFYHCIFFDAFAPEVQPELWTQEMFDQVFLATAPGGCLVTYCSKGIVRRSMEHAGFSVTRIPGAPGKRQMLQAFKPS